MATAQTIPATELKPGDRVTEESGGSYTVARVLITGKKSSTVSAYPMAESATNLPRHYIPTDMVTVVR